jgi:hypothetical protein
MCQGFLDVVLRDIPVIRSRMFDQAFIRRYSVSQQQLSNEEFDQLKGRYDKVSPACSYLSILYHNHTIFDYNIVH